MKNTDLATEQSVLSNKKENTNQIEYSKKEEWINRISHLVGGAISLVGGIALLIKTCSSLANARAIISVCLFSVSLLLLYVMSTLYHWQPVGKRRRAVFRRFDHCAIPLLIAGTYAPFTMIEMNKYSEVWATIIVLVVLAMAILSVVLNAINVEKFKFYCLSSYVIMGWACVIRIDLLVKNLPAFLFLLGGGIVYTVGILFYKSKKVKYNHAIWHFFVIAGSALHYVAIFCYLIP